MKKGGLKTKGWLKQCFLMMGVGLCFTGAVTFTSHAQGRVVGTFEGYPIYDNQFGGAEIDDSHEEALIQRGAAYASKYDPRLTGKIATRIEDQGDTNTCWAFSVIAAIEGNLIKKGYADSTVNLSENHLAYFFYNRQADPLGLTKGDFNLNGRYSWEQNGGTLQGTALALATWSGVVKETDSEDDRTGAYAPKALAGSACYKSDYHVKNTYFYNYSVNNIKKAIMDYGAVASGIYMDAEYWNSATSSYYCPEDEGNHAVAIVGWDDNYSRNKFNRADRPSSDGAWIVKNSYGSSFGDGGYMYVSYQDASLTEIVAFDMEPAAESYDHNYQYDGSANPAVYWQFNNGTTYANVFTAKGSKSGYNEILKAVSVDVLTTDVKYSLQVYTGVTGTSKPTNGKAMFSSPQTGVLTNAGYNQITLNNPVTLTAGEKYSIVISLSAAKSNKVMLGAEASMTASWISFVANVGKGQGYMYMDGHWYDFGNAGHVGVDNITNLRIKAYTDDTTQKTTYKLSSSSLGISKGSSEMLSLLTTPSSVKRKVTWSSSDKKVAVVSNSGKVKAKTYGTTTIKAKFVAGGKTKTLSCKVTVGPSKVKNVKVRGSKGKITVNWKKNSAADGYVIYYSKKKGSGYKKLAAITSGSKSKYTSKKLSGGTYYVKMRPYVNKGKKKLYGSYTAEKEVKVK